MVAVLEEWTSLNLGDNVNDSASWAPMAGGNGVGLVSALGFATGVRAAAWEGTTAYGGFLTKWTDQAQVYASFYWNSVLNAGAGYSYIGKISPYADGSAGAEFRVNSSNQFQIRNGTASVDISAMVAVLDGTWYRFDWLVNQTGGTQSVGIYTGANLHGTTPDEILTGAYSQGNVGQLILGSVANPSATDVSSKYSYIGLQDSAFTAPYALGGKLDTPTNFSFIRVDGLREINASVTAVSAAVSYDLEVQVLTGANPAVELDWGVFNTFNSLTPTWALDSADGLVWAETYRGRVIAKVA